MREREQQRRNAESSSKDEAAEEQQGPNDGFFNILWYTKEKKNTVAGLFVILFGSSP